MGCDRHIKTEFPQDGPFSFQFNPNKDWRRRGWRVAMYSVGVVALVAVGDGGGEKEVTTAVASVCQRNNIFKDIHLFIR